MAHSAAEIFRVILVHNKLMAAEDVDALLADCPDPEDCITSMVIGEMLTEEVAAKVMTLYRHNLAKQGVTGPTAGSTPSSSPAPPHTPVSRPSTASAASPPAPPPYAPAHNPQSNNHVQPTGHAQPAHAPAPPTTAAPAHPPAGSSVHSPAATSAHAPVNAPAHTPVPAGKPPVAPPADAASFDDVYAPIPIPGGAIDLSQAGKELVFRLLRAARDVRASDLHIKADAIPVVRVCTLLRELQMPPIPADILERSLLSILTEAQQATFMKNRDIDFSYDTQEYGRFRGNYLREHRGMDAVFRLISGKVPSFDELKLPEQIKRFTTYRQGIVLVTGPKGSGKTTTLASLIDLINANRPEHIITIEDPIEFVHPSKKGHVNQREVGPHTNSFANALRAALREAPDVIMVGEMRDLETISLAITAAETGHLVFGTLHTPDAARTINRVLDVYPPEEQAQVRTMFSESLRGIICQHLLPGLDGKSMHLAVEILFNTGAISNLIRDNRAFQLKGMMQTGKKLGMVLMDESLVKLVREGKISKEDAMSRSDNHAQMDRDLPAAAPVAGTAKGVHPQPVESGKKVMAH